MFKELTGEDEIMAEEKFKPPFSFRSFARLLFSTNALPACDDDSAGFYDRWMIVPFERRFRDTGQEKDRNDLKVILADPTELSGVLNNALAALRTVQQRGIDVTPSMRQTFNKFRGIDDPLAEWIGENIVGERGAFISKEALYRAFEEAPGTPELSDNAFGRALKAAMPGLDDGQRSIDGKRTWVWLGIKLKED